MTNISNTMPGEIWKPVPSHLGITASSEGRVKMASHVAPCPRWGSQLRPEKVLNGEMLNGYRSVSITRQGKRKRTFVHRLVCEAFHGPALFEGATVDHIDGDRLNNRPENLEWVTRAENTRRQNECGRGVPKGEDHPGAKLTNEQSDSIRAMREKGMRVSEIAQIYEVSASLIYKIMAGLRRH